MQDISALSEPLTRSTTLRVAHHHVDLVRGSESAKSVLQEDLSCYTMRGALAQHRQVCVHTVYLQRHHRRQRCGPEAC